MQLRVDFPCMMFRFGLLLFMVNNVNDDYDKARAIAQTLSTNIIRAALRQFHSLGSEWARAYNDVLDEREMSA